jgi:hypothetical protein
MLLPQFHRRIEIKLDAPKERTRTNFNLTNQAGFAGFVSASMQGGLNQQTDKLKGNL